MKKPISDFTKHDVLETLLESAIVSKKMPKDSSIVIIYKSIHKRKTGYTYLEVKKYLGV